jgi:NADH-quinone oxidoreductase subunit M
MQPWLLTFLVLVPTAGAILIGFLPREPRGLSRGVAFAVGLLEFALSLGLLLKWNPAAPMQFEQNTPWVASAGIHWHLGVDGFSVWLVLLTTFLTPVAILSSFRSVEARVKEYMICFLILETGMVGTFVALDLFVFYVFWEVTLIPMYFIIGVWGAERRIYAAIKFVLYTMAGSLLMLGAILYVYFKTGVSSFDLMALKTKAIPAADQMWPFLAFALAFAIKVPMFPLHTWLPDAHVQAPTAGSVILAAILLKMGTYGFLRWAFPLFPVAATEAAPWIAILATVGVTYGALVSYAQKDLKKLVAYSSVSHLGFVMLGIASLEQKATEGAIYQMLNHGISTGALFLLVGVLYDRRHTKMMDEFGGLARVMPFFAAVFGIIMLSSIGLPGLNGFVGEFLILIGSYSSSIPWAKVFTVVAATGVVLGAMYMLWAYQKVVFGPVTREENKSLKDLSWREGACLVPLCLLVIFMGVYPKPFLSKMDRTTRDYLAEMKMRQEMSYRVAAQPRPEATAQAVRAERTMGPRMAPLLPGQMLGAPRLAAPGEPPRPAGPAPEGPGSPGGGAR